MVVSDRISYFRRNTQIVDSSTDSIQNLFNMPKVTVLKNSKNVVLRATSQAKTRRRRPRRRNNNSLGLNPPGDVGKELTLSYFKSLVDPFENAPPKIGWGCMVPSTIFEGYLRSPVTLPSTATDLVIVQLPGASQSFGFFNSVTDSWTFALAASNLANAGSIAANAAEGRVLSCGIRAFPNIPLTSAPGVVYTGAFVGTNVSNLILLKTNDFVNFPTSHQSIGVSGASATGRPIDPDSFVFNIPSVSSSGYGGATFQSSDIPFSVPYIAFVGLPAGSTVYVESVVNIEATQTIAHLGQTVMPDSDGTTGRLCDFWSTPEAMYNSIRDMLPHPGRPGEAAASMDSTMLSNIWAGVRSVAGSALRQGIRQAVGYGGQLLLNSISQRQFSSPSGSGQKLSNAYKGYLL